MPAGLGKPGAKDAPAAPFRVFAISHSPIILLRDGFRRLSVQRSGRFVQKATAAVVRAGPRRRAARYDCIQPLEQQPLAGGYRDSHGPSWTPRRSHSSLRHSGPIDRPEPVFAGFHMARSAGSKPTAGSRRTWLPAGGAVSRAVVRESAGSRRGSPCIFSFANETADRSRLPASVRCSGEFVTKLIL